MLSSLLSLLFSLWVFDSYLVPSHGLSFRHGTEATTGAKALIVVA